MNTGDKFELENNQQILSLKSPRNRLDGPFVVVTKNLHKRWAIVALRWDGKTNGLGIRWFHGNVGNPFSRRPTWLIIPEELHEGVINLLKKGSNKRALRSFLSNNKPDNYCELQKNYESEVEII